MHARFWRIILGCVMMMALLSAVASVAASEQESRLYSGTYSIQLVSIICLKKDDAVGKDEPIIRIGGITVWTGQNFATGSSASLLTVPARSFTNSVNLDLYEQDNWPSADDFLGRYTVQSTDAGAGARTVTFSEHNALYEITYRVN